MTRQKLPGGDLYISRFKARLTAMGNFQKPGVDFSDTFASVMRGQTFRILLTIRLLHPEHRMEKWDAKAAFINAPLDDKDEIYIEQPSGHVEPGKEHMVGRLVKALYGLAEVLERAFSQGGFPALLQGRIRVLSLDRRRGRFLHCGDPCG